MTITKKPLSKGVAGCIILAVLICILALLAMKLGSIDVTYSEIINGLFVEYDKKVATIYNLRFPRILVSIFAGAALSLSGLLLQAVLKNPLVDPGIIGILGGASLASMIMLALFPTLYLFVPLFAFLGGFIAFSLIYSLAWKGSLDPTRIILVGIAVSAVFIGISEIFDGISNRTGVSVSMSGLSQLVWADVEIIAIYGVIGIIISIFLSPACNLLSLEDKTIRGLGVNVDRLRFLISIIAVLLVAAATSVVGVIGFLALIVPHISRKIIGSDNRILVPFCVLLGGFTLLLADTIGRIIASPSEISASIIMSVIGGPFFIILLKKGDKNAKY